MKNIDRALLIGGGLLAVYLIWQAGKIKKKADDIIDTVSGGIANVIIRLTFPEPVKIPGYMILPDQRAIPLNQTPVDKVPGKEQYVFTFGGVNYEVIGRTETGNYVARKI